MKRSKFPYSLVGMGLGAVLCATLVTRTLMGGPPTVPRPADSAHALREEKAPAGVVDMRSSIPEGALVGGNGLVEPAQPETRVAGSAPGRIAKVAVKEGDRVEEGAILVELDSAVEKAALAAAEAEVAVAKADLTRALHGQRAEDIEASAAEASAAKTRADLSASQLARTEELAKKGAVSADELDRAKSAAAADSASFKAADARRRLFAAGSRAEDISSAKARVSAATARAEQAKATVERLVVRAPIAGEVLRVKYRAGEYYTPGGEALLLMGDTSKLRVRMDVDERDIAKVREGAQAWVTADAFPGRKFSGKVAEIGRRMGRKNVRTDEPTERLDTKILEVVIDLEAAPDLVPGLRVISYVTDAPAGG
ncbi:MAG: efflux RND transporter periplasmic adaptor subunit [Polyangiaceae bacterium]